ncbi:MAG: sodium:proton antiporter NhaD [Oligoflexia bacterium]|nr:sodium:proton antiporter NhaD [Oligoflexia bacterium]
MSEIVIVSIFVLGYLFIILEHKIHLNKAASAILTGAILWCILGATVGTSATHHLNEYIGDVAGIIFFMLGALTIVEIVDYHKGFDTIFYRVKEMKKIPLMWFMCWLTFFLSSILDNLTTAIVMVAMLKDIPMNKKADKLTIAGMVIIASNAGGAWTPIGDITTTMLWIANRITTGVIMQELFIPCVISLLVPLLIAGLFFFKENEVIQVYRGEGKPSKKSQLILLAGISLLIAVPLFKAFFHLTPSLAMILSAGLMWVIVEVFLRDKATKENLVFHILKRIDYTTLYFFIGILLAVSALKEAGTLQQMATFFSESTSNFYIFSGIMGVISAIVDNIPLLAATIKMYSLEQYPTNHPLWVSLAFTTGYGGNMLIIGSAAGVAVMNLIGIDFMWYFRRISGLAVIGYVVGLALIMLLA